MKDRIKQYIDFKGITAGELAVRLDVQRSNISHILNGRNKPGATFIEKLLLAFTDLNARWLMTGMGEMIIKSNVQEVNGIPETNNKVEPEVFNKLSESIDEIEKIVLIYSDGTFSSLRQR